MFDKNISDFRPESMNRLPQEVMLQKTYGLLGLSFLPCALGAGVGMMLPLGALFSMGMTGAIVLTLAMFAFFYGMIFMIEKNRYSQTGVTLLMVFTFGMGVFLAPLLQVSLSYSNGAKLVLMAALMTAGVFFAMSALARKLNFNTHALARFLLVGGIVLMIGVVANLFLRLPVLSLTLSAVFVIFSSLYILFDVRRIIEGGEDSHISAALSIFISVYNVFTSLLRLLLAFAGGDD